MKRFATQLRRILVAEGLMPKTAAGRPYMSEITRQKYREGEAFMAYYIDAAKNHSKFYEMVIIPDPYGGATLKKRWGALGQGRHQDKVEFFADIESAKRAMDRHGQAKLRKGYKDAFKSQPVGQYPVGLDRIVGFGWGTQAITKCVPALRDMSAMISTALSEVVQNDPADLMIALEGMTALVSDIPDSMAKEIAMRLRGPVSRMKKNPRFIADPAKTSRELMTLKRYIDRQISECNI